MVGMAEECERQIRTARDAAYVDGMAAARDGDKWRNVGLGLILGLAVWPVVAINRRLGVLKNKRAEDVLGSPSPRRVNILSNGGASLEDAGLSRFVAGGRNSLRRFTVRQTITAVLAAAVAVAPLHAGSLRARALELASAVQPATTAAPEPTCATIIEVAEQDAQEPATPLKWFLGGFLVPFIVPVAAHVATPHPPGRNLAPHPPELHPCYIATYSERVTSRRVLGAWTGVASFLVLIALNAADR